MSDVAELLAPSLKIKSVNKKNTLPPRYPRADKILVFESIYQVDDAIESILQMHRKLALASWGLPAAEWQHITSPLSCLIDRFKTAFTELERMWRPLDWEPEKDDYFTTILKDDIELMYRLYHLLEEHRQRRRDKESNTERFRANDPAQLACGSILYSALHLQRETRSRRLLEADILELKTQIPRYFGVSMQIVKDGQAIFAPGRDKGAVGAPYKLIEAMIRMHGLLDIATLWALLKAEYRRPTIRTLLVLTYVGDENIDYRVGKKIDTANKRDVLKLLYKIYSDINYGPLEYLRALLSRDPSMDFSGFWSVIGTECHKRSILGFESTEMLSIDDDELVFREAGKEYIVSRSVVWNKFRGFKRKK